MANKFKNIERKVTIGTDDPDIYVRVNLESDDDEENAFELSMFGSEIIYLDIRSLTALKNTCAQALREYSNR